MELEAIKDGLASFAEYGIMALLVAGFSFGIYATFLSNPAYQKTLYISINSFPLKGFYQTGIFYNYSSTSEVFYGEAQSNGTACIYEVVINSTKIITNPVQVEKIYYNSTNFEYLNGSYVKIPFGYTLLCPNIINSSV